MRRQRRAHHVHRVIAHGYAGRPVVERELLGVRHRGKLRHRVAELDSGQQVLFARCAHLPHRLPPPEAESGQRPRLRQHFDVALVEPRPRGQVFDPRERAIAPRLLDAPPSLFAQAFHEPQTKAHGRRIAVGHRLALESAVPVARIDAGGQHLDAVALGVLHDSPGRVKAHRLAVDERRCERRGMMHLQP